MKRKKILSLLLILILLCSIFAGLAIGCKHQKVKKKMSIQLFERYDLGIAAPTTSTIHNNLAQKFTIGETGPNNS